MEIWKDIKNYEGRYQVSDLGRIKSLKRKGCLKDRILKQFKDLKGYYRVELFKKNNPKRFVVYILVATALLNHTPCGFKKVVDHKDNNPLNNNLNNLQLTTQRHNCSKDKKGYTSKYVGVVWSKKAKKWQSQININSKLKYLGTYKNEYKAHLAYQNALKNIKGKE